MNKFKAIRIMSLIAIPLSALTCIVDLLVGNYLLAALMGGATILWVHNYNKASQLEDLSKRD